MAESDLETLLAFQCKAFDVPMPEREARLITGRRYRYDFCWPAQKLVVEIEGGTYTQGRHIRPNGFTEDCRKYALATILGYRVMRVTGAMVRSGEALTLIQRALGLPVSEGFYVSAGKPRIG